ncbi:hypothetical protein MPER_00335, partial [Moniliophthora perniciosa FA553]
VLLLNKKDVLACKIAKSPIINFFPDFSGGTDIEAACDYFVQRFLSWRGTKFKVSNCSTAR